MTEFSLAHARRQQTIHRVIGLGRIACSCAYSGACVSAGRSKRGGSNENTRFTPGTRKLSFAVYVVEVAIVTGMHDDLYPSEYFGCAK